MIKFCKFVLTFWFNKNVFVTENLQIESVRHNVISVIREAQASYKVS